MKKLYLVLGDGGVGKSVLTRCLTGINREKRTWIRKSNQIDINIWVWMRSVQEMTPPMMPADVVTDITSAGEANFEYYYIPIRISPVWGCPGADTYISAFISAGFIIEGIAILGMSLSQLPFPVNLSIPIVTLPASSTMPGNFNAAHIRQTWGWL